MDPRVTGGGYKVPHSGPKKVNFVGNREFFGGKKMVRPSIGQIFPEKSLGFHDRVLDPPLIKGRRFVPALAAKLEIRTVLYDYSRPAI